MAIHHLLWRELIRYRKFIIIILFAYALLRMRGARDLGLKLIIIKLPMIETRLLNHR